MLTSWRDHIFRCTGPLGRESSFDVFFDLHLNKRLSKQSRRRRFETPSRSLWCHGNELLNSWDITKESLHTLPFMFTIPHSLLFLDFSLTKVFSGFIFMNFFAVRIVIMSHKFCLQFSSFAEYVVLVFRQATAWPVNRMFKTLLWCQALANIVT